ncbi:hypothetical protein OPT61_g5944 [Boeremia exigua]|uniref:Uncharacterized protein n=1 Tax=Boeremia exigua TaxID=749465 RepID=A0ACC2I8L4_9PLEO|nr:hypothetical protein OPT61_g5944 [Boeremia exigua]
MALAAAYGSTSYAGIAWLVAKIAVAAIYRIATYPLRSVRGTTLFKDVRSAAIRCMMNHISIAQSRYLVPSTTERYLEAYCKPQGLEPNTLSLNTKNGKAVAHWMGDPDADAVILYCHGGGYTQPGNEGNIRQLQNLVKDLNSDKTKPSVSVLLLAYTLAPEAVYPSQLREAAVVLAHLVQETRRSPSSIFLAGDSAGGNLALSLLSHILHPHPDVFVLKLESPLAGVLLMSPWVSFRTDYPSFKTNETLDMLGLVGTRKWSAMFLGKTDQSNPEADPGIVSGDAWSEACLNPSTWWNGMHHIVNDVFIWWGGYEVFVDPLREFETEFKAGWAAGGGKTSRVLFVESAKEVHVAPMADIMIPGAQKGDVQIAIDEWFKARLQQLPARYWARFPLAAGNSREDPELSGSCRDCSGFRYTIDAAKHSLNGPQITAHGSLDVLSSMPERSCCSSMIDNVFALHEITGDDEVTFPFNIKDYQRYVFGDDRLAHRFGTDCAKAFIARSSGSKAAQHTTTTPTSNQSAADDVAVAVLSDYVPTATHSLRNHFVACLNRHLVSTNANPAIKIDINAVEDDLHERNGPHAEKAIYRIDRERVGRRTIIVLSDIRLSQDREHQIKSSLRATNVDNPITFVYLASVLESSKSKSLSPILGFIVSPSVKDVEDIAHGASFIMNASFVQYVLGRDDEEFCRFLRRQDDGFARLLLDYAIGGRYYDNEFYQANVKFLRWEVGTRESL